MTFWPLSFYDFDWLFEKFYTKKITCIKSWSTISLSSISMCGFKTTLLHFHLRPLNLAAPYDALLPIFSWTFSENTSAKNVIQVRRKFYFGRRTELFSTDQLIGQDFKLHKLSKIRHIGLGKTKTLIARNVVGELQREHATIRGIVLFWFEFWKLQFCWKTLSNIPDAAHAEIWTHIASRWEDLFDTLLCARPKVWISSLLWIFETYPEIVQ